MSEHLVSGATVFAELRDRWGLQDSKVLSIALNSRDGGLEVRLRFAKQFESQRDFDFVELTFIGVELFDVCWNSRTSEFYALDSYIAGFFDGKAYLSMDPYDYTVNSPDDRDCGVIIAKSVTCRFFEEDGR